MLYQSRDDRIAFVAYDVIAFPIAKLLAIVSSAGPSSILVTKQRFFFTFPFFLYLKRIPQQAIVQRTEDCRCADRLSRFRLESAADLLRRPVQLSKAKTDACLQHGVERRYVLSYVFVVPYSGVALDGSNSSQGSSSSFDRPPLAVRTSFFLKTNEFKHWCFILSLRFISPSAEFWLLLSVARPSRARRHQRRVPVFLYHRFRRHC